jgi:hypothetical protein
MTTKSKLKEDWGKSGNYAVPQFAQIESRRHINKVVKTTLDMIDQIDLGNLDELLRIEYIPDPTNPFKDLKERKNSTTYLLVYECYQSVTSRRSESVNDELSDN